jgi:hypothetical protein
MGDKRAVGRLVQAPDRQPSQQSCPRCHGRSTAAKTLHLASPWKGEKPGRRRLGAEAQRPLCSGTVARQRTLHPTARTTTRRWALSAQARASPCPHLGESALSAYSAMPRVTRPTAPCTSPLVLPGPGRAPPLLARIPPSSRRSKEVSPPHVQHLPQPAGPASHPERRA